MNWHVAIWQKASGSIIKLFRNAGVKKDIIDLQDKQIAILREENAILTSKLQVSETERATLEAKIIDLAKELENLRPSQDKLDETSKKLLRCLARFGGTLTLEQMAGE